MCPCDLDLWPIVPKIWLRDPEGVMNMFAYFEVYRRFRFWICDTHYLLINPRTFRRESPSCPGWTWCPCGPEWSAYRQASWLNSHEPRPQLHPVQHISSHIDWLTDLFGFNDTFGTKWLYCASKKHVAVKKVKLMRKLTMLRVGNTYNKPIQ